MLNTDRCRGGRDGGGGERAAALGGTAPSPADEPCGGWRGGGGHGSHGAQGQDRKEPSLSGVFVERLSALLFSGHTDKPVYLLFVRPRRVWPRECISHTQGQNSVLGASGGEWPWDLAGEWESPCTVCQGSRHGCP